MIRVAITQDEALLICDACNGWAYQAEPKELLPQLLPLQVQDACEGENLAQKWDVDCAALAAKLRGLSLEETQEILAAVARFWTPGYYTQPDVRQQVYRAFWRPQEV